MLMFDFMRMRKENEKTIMTQEEFIMETIKNFDKSEARVKMLEGEKYYNNGNDINNRVIYRFEDERPVVDETKPNNKISHGFMKLLVDEKVGYFIGQAPKITSDNLDLENKANGILDDEFIDILHDVCIEASNKGIAWLHPFINEGGKLEFINIPSEQIIPLWRDIKHTKLDGVIRYYFVDEYVGTSLQQTMKVEYWTHNEVKYYVNVNGTLIEDIEVVQDSEHLGHFNVDGQEFGWGEIPYIPFKNNSSELNDLTFVKSIVDEYDKSVSDTANLLDEIQDIVYVLKNYGGTNLSEFMRDLKYYKSIKVDEDGGVETINSQINIDAVEKHLDRLKKDFYQFGQGVDINTDRFGNSPSGVALEFLYSNLKLKVNNTERKFKSSFKRVFYFVCKYLEIQRQGKYDPNDLKVTFIRTIISNIAETIDSINKSVTVISKKTALENHPWVANVNEELERIKDEEETLGNFESSFTSDYEEEEVKVGEVDGEDRI